MDFYNIFIFNPDLEISKKYSEDKYEALTLNCGSIYIINISKDFFNFFNCKTIILFTYFFILIIIYNLKFKILRELKFK